MLRQIIFGAALGLSLCANALSLKVTPWQSICSAPQDSKPLECQIPQPLSGSVEPAIHDLPETSLERGEAKSHKVQHRFLNGDQILKYELKIFEVMPKSGPKYYQAQFEWITPARATCMVSVDASKTQWSPLTCVSFDKDTSKRFGILVQTI